MNQPIATLTADFSQSGNDMYWKIWAGEDKFIRWIGYDDAYWWNNRAGAENFCNRIGPSTGREFRLDVDTNTVAVFPASGTPTRSAETTGSVGEADGGPVRESGDAETSSGDA